MAPVPGGAPEAPSGHRKGIPAGQRLIPSHRTFGHHPLVAFADHAQAESGEPGATLLRPGNAGSSTAADHIETARLALAQPLTALRLGRQTLIRTDSGGSIHA
jgi:hypothetical protein